MGLNIYLISYWGINEGLTQATVLPHVQILEAENRVDKIILFTIERSDFTSVELGSKVEHIPLKSSKRLWSKVADRFLFSRILKFHFNRIKPDFIIARTSLAAWLIREMAVRNQIPFSVESFEPHVEYMIEAGVWKVNGLRSKTLLADEAKQKHQAKFLLPLTRKYIDLLTKQGVEISKMMEMPCCVNHKAFRFDEMERNQTRSKLSILDKSVVGIYTGKIGGIYLDEDAIKLFQSAKNYFGEKFHLIILSPDEKVWLEKLKFAGFSDADYSIDFVSQADVPKYLSAADYAFSLHKPTPSKIAISPIKNAEFWANGLPIIMPSGIGDDSEVTEMKGLGAVVQDFENIPSSVFDFVTNEKFRDRNDNACVKFAQEQRSFSIVKDCYKRMLDSISN